jgi:hypothetical protein
MKGGVPGSPYSDQKFFGKLFLKFGRRVNPPEAAGPKIINPSFEIPEFLPRTCARTEFGKPKI